MNKYVFVSQLCIDSELEIVVYNKNIVKGSRTW